MLQNTKKMGNKPHHSGHYGGGIDLSKAKTPHDNDIQDMPLFKMGEPYKMSMSMRGPLDKKGAVIKAAAKGAAKAAAEAGAEAAAEGVDQIYNNTLEERIGTEESQESLRPEKGEPKLQSK